MEIVQPPTSQFCRWIWIFLLLESPARAAEHLPGRCIQLTGWDSRLGGGEPSPLPHFSFPPLSKSPARLPVTEKNPRSPPEAAWRVRARCPPRASRARVFRLGDPLAHGLLLVLPAPRSSAPYSPYALGDLRDPRPSKALAPHPAATRTRRSLPGSQPWQPRGRRRRASGSAAELLPFRLLLAGAAGCLELVAGGSGTGVATGAPAAEPEAGAGRKTAGAARARARLER